MSSWIVVSDFTGGGREGESDGGRTDLVERGLADEVGFVD